MDVIKEDSIFNYDIFFSKFYKDFQEYTFKNQVLIAASGFAVGISTTDFIKSITHDILKPISISLSLYLFKVSHLPIKKYPMIYNISILFYNFISLCLIWLSTIFISFFVIEYILNRKIIGLSSIITDKEKVDFNKQKKESLTKNNIIPNAVDRQELNDIEIMRVY